MNDSYYYEEPDEQVPEKREGGTLGRVLLFVGLTLFGTYMDINHPLKPAKSSVTFPYNNERIVCERAEGDGFEVEVGDRGVLAVTCEEKGCRVDNVNPKIDPLFETPYLVRRCRKELQR
jgi:hypothetical protein